MTDRSLYRIMVGGTDISEKVAPLLISIRVHLSADLSSHTADIDLDDTNGRVRMPSKGETAIVMLGRTAIGIGRVFEGTVDDVRSKGARGGGRVLAITCKSADTGGKAKEQTERHWDKKSLADVMREAGQAAGLKVEVDRTLGKIEREWWGQLGESFYHFGQRVAREVGGVFQVVGKRAVIAKMGAGLSLTGAPLSSVRAVWGDNLINWDLSPIESRPRFDQVEARWYDPKEAKWKRERVRVSGVGSGGGGKAGAITRFSRASKDEAKAAAESGKSNSEREQGSGTVQIHGDPRAVPEGLCIVSGARPGVDGAYRIETVDHELDRTNGFVTSMALKQPQDGAGKDSRPAAGGGKSGAGASGGVLEAGAIPGNVG